MNELFDVLENCISAFEQGETKEAILARFPELRDQLGPMLEAARLARQMKVTEPPAEVIQRGRVRLLQQAAQMRAHSRSAPQRVLPAFQRLALAFALTALFVFSGTRLVRASSSALPGENLYSVKRTWETLRLLLEFNPAHREALAGEFENERLDEVSDLLLEGRHEPISFSGVVTMVNDQIHVSGIRVAITVATQMPETALQNGAAVIVSGRTIGDGFVEATSIELLPAGSVVPVGQPVEAESDAANSQMPTSGTEGESPPTTGEDSGSTGTESSSGEKSGELNNQGGSSDKFQVEGSVESINNGVWVINGQAVDVQGAEINGQVSVGSQVEVEGIFTPEGRFQATKVDVKNSSDGQSGSDAGKEGSGGGGDGNGSGSHDAGGGGDDSSGGSGGSDD